MSTEVEAARKDEMYAPDSFSVDDVENVSPSVTEVEGASEEEIEIEGRDHVETDKDGSAAMRREIAELKDEILRLSSRKEPKETPKEAPKEEEKLTRGQIAKILADHKDDPEVLLNVIDYMAEQKATEIKDTTVKDINYRQWHSQLSGTANQILSEDSFLAANPAIQGRLDEMTENLGLSTHPVGRLAAYAIYRLSEEAKSKKPDEKALREKDMKSRVLDKTRPPTKESKTFGLTPAQMDAAKKFGVKPETYAKFVRRA